MEENTILPKLERNGFFTTFNFHSPDGQDCLKKTFHSAKVGAVAGAWIGMVEVIGINTPATFLHGLGRISTWALPGAGVFATYAATTCIVGAMREKDGALNHLIGGAVAGGMVGITAKSGGGKWGCSLAVLFSLWSGMRKQMENDKIAMISDVNGKDFGKGKPGPDRWRSIGTNHRYPDLPINY